MDEKKYYQEYYQKNKEKINQTNKKWRQNNPEKFKQIQKDYNAKVRQKLIDNPELKKPLTREQKDIRNEKLRKKLQENPELRKQRIENIKKWQKENKDKVIESQKRYKKKNRDKLRVIEQRYRDNKRLQKLKEDAGSLLEYALSTTSS